MPRNPDKRRCAVPDCRNWAMRKHTCCRPHRDAELGPRGAGAPLENLNNLKHGRHASPLPPAQLHEIAARLIDDPDQLPLHLDQIARSVGGRVADPLETMIATLVVLRHLTDLIAKHHYAAELQTFLAPFPEPQRRHFETQIWDQVTTRSWTDRLLYLRDIRVRVEKR